MATAASGSKPARSRTPGRSRQRGDEPAPFEDPWPIDGEEAATGGRGCGCDDPPARPVRPPRDGAPDRPVADPAPRSGDCCRQILEALRCIPGIDPDCLRMRKPKQSTGRKLDDLCGAVPVRDRLVPILLLILRRHRAKVPVGNDFESGLRRFLTGLPAQQLAALHGALDAYDSLPAAARDCPFDTRFDAWPDDRPIDPGFIARNVIGETFILGRFVRFGPTWTPILPVLGTARPWEQTFAAPGEPGRFDRVPGPWPWICAVSPVANKAVDNHTDWYRNESSCVPGNVPRGSTQYFQHEFAVTCSTSPGSQPGTLGPIVCRVDEPSGPGGPGSFGFAECPGGSDYRTFDRTVNKQVCLTIPRVDPGAEVGLRGINFLSRDATVTVRKVDGPPFPPIPPVPLSDWAPDTTTAATVATCAVRDHAYFVMPVDVRDAAGNDVPLPPGRYALSMVVPNVTRSAPVAGEPAPNEFRSNEILFDLQPDPNQRYQLSCDEAYCVEETDGLGSDEPWFRAIVATAELPVAGATIPWPSPTAVDVLQDDDVDSGEWISMPSASLFADRIGRKLVSVAVLGLEVDSDDAARKQIDNFWDAYGLYLSQFYVALGASTDLGLLGNAVAASIQAGAISMWVWVTGGAFLAILAAGALYALWAPADPIGVDAMTYTARQLFERTDPDPGHVPVDNDYLRIHQLHSWSEDMTKAGVPGGTSIYSVRRHYRSNWEDSHYRLAYRVKRI